MKSETANTDLTTLAKWAPLAATMLLFAGTVLASILIRQAIIGELDAAFTARTQNVSNGLRDKLQFVEMTVQSMANLFETRGEVSRDQFSNAASRQMSDSLGIQALEWIPMVPHRLRASREQAAREDGMEDFEFKRWQRNGQWNRVAEQWADEYYPVYYVYPTAGNETALGIDLASHPTRQQALFSARNTGKPTATGKVTLAQEKEGNAGFLLFVATGDQGFALGVFRITDLVDAVLSYRDVSGLQLRITDESSNSDDGKLLYQSAGFSPNSDSRWQVAIPYNMGGRQWKLHWSYQADHVSSVMGWNSAYAFAVGSLLSCLMGIVLQQHVRKRMDVERLVATRTAQLKSAERELLLNQFATDTATDAIFFIRKDGMFSYVNRTASQFLGYSQDELLQMGVSDISPEYQKSSWPTRWQETKQQRVIKFESYHQRKDGSQYDCEITKHFLEFDDTEIIHARVRDITQEKIEKKALIDAKRFAEESERRFRNLADSASPLFWITELDSTCSWLNKRWLDYCRKPLEDEIGYGWLNTVHPEDRERVKTAYQTAFERRAGFGLEYRLRRYDGAFRWFLVHATPRRDSDGRFIGFVGMSVDIHETYQAKVKLERYASDLEKANVDLEQFAYVASHDLQEPLRKITAYAELVSEECSAQINEEGRKYLAIVIDGAQRLKRLVRDLLEFSRISSRGKEPSPTDANSSFQEACDALEIAIAENDAEISRDKLPTVEADASQLSMLFQNFISNAIKYRSDAAPKIHVGVRELANEGYEFYIQDNGIGIEERYFGKIFQIFQRLHGRQQRGGGTGIGLANCKRIVERFGGRIWVDSIPGEGSRFYFTINSCANNHN